LRKLTRVLSRRPAARRQAALPAAVPARRALAEFSGPDSAGKLAALAALSRDTGRQVYRVEVAALISKFIGETEKNLSRVFDDAQAVGAILYFDEADALFGKRSNVKDTHDRYANIEFGYLLGRIDAYDGLVVLATNGKDALADAVVRRLRYVIEFPVSESAPERRRSQRLRSSRSMRGTRA
jgi:SpoVK/Ycf46/Vps4 family AAA+-type ATPase